MRFGGQSRSAGDDETGTMRSRGVARSRTVGDVRLSGAEALCMLFRPGILLLGPWYSKVVVPSQHPDPSVGSDVALQGGGS
jgi:hypothetical protein